MDLDLGSGSDLVMPLAKAPAMDSHSDSDLESDLGSDSISALGSDSEFESALD